MRLFHVMHKRCSYQHGLARNWYLRRISKKLQLDESQQARLSALQNDIVSTRSCLTEIHHDRSQLLDEVFGVDGFNRQSALQYLNMPRLAFEEQVPAIVDSLEEFYQSLNLQQREQLRAMLHKQHRQSSHCWH